MGSRSQIRIRMAGLVLFASLGVASGRAGYVPIESFEFLSIGSVNNQSQWYGQSGVEVVADPSDAMNQVLGVFSPNILAHRDTTVLNDDTRMFFMRFRFDRQLNASFGLSHVSFPTEESDFGPELSLTNASTELRIGAGEMRDTVANLETGRWYNLWLQLDTAEDRVQAWLHDRPQEAASDADKLTNLSGDAWFDFTTSTSRNLVNFYIKNGSGGPGTYGPLYFDDLYLESTVDVNLSNPLALECVDSLGDIDGNGIVEFADFLTLSSHYGFEVPNHTFGDLNCDGSVGFADFLTLSANYGNSVGIVNAVPEPRQHVWVWGWPAMFACLSWFRKVRRQ